MTKPATASPLRNLAALLLAAALCGLAGGCSTYNGPITNARQVDALNGPPMLTGGFAP